MVKDYYELLVRAQEGLLGAITPIMRGISLEVNEDSLLVNLYLEKQPTSLEHELMQEFIDHVCINIPWLSLRKAKLKTIVTTEPFQMINKDTRVDLRVYLRYEPEFMII